MKLHLKVTATGWGIGGPVELETVGPPKSLRSGNGWPLIALRCLLLMLVSRLSTPICIANRCSCSGSPESGGI